MDTACNILNKIRTPFVVPHFNVAISSVPMDSRGIFTYRQTSSINRTKSQHSNVSLLVLQLSPPNQSNPSVKSRMKMQLEHRQAMLQLHLSDQQFYCLLSCVLYYRFEGIFFTLVSLELGQSSVYHSTWKVTLTDMDKVDSYPSTTKYNNGRNVCITLESIMYCSA